MLRWYLGKKQKVSATDTAIDITTISATVVLL